MVSSQPIDARSFLGVAKPATTIEAVATELFGWTPAAHHLIWLQAIKKLAAGEIKNNRLLIVAPPGHAKTNYGGITFPAWHLGHNPYAHVLSFSATAALSTKTSMTVRDTVALSSVWKEMFPGVKPDYDRGWGQTSWYLQRPLAPGDKDPSFFSTSIGSSAVLGGRGDVFIFDDVSTQENTRTKERREKVKDWIAQTAMSRASTGNEIMIAVMTRWHTDDMAGYFEREHGFQMLHMPANGYWEHIDNTKLARVEEGPLWPEHIPAEFLESQLRIMGPYKYTAMYQGNPTAVEGAIFAEEHFGPFYIPYGTEQAMKILAQHRRALTPPWDAVVNWAGVSVPLVGRYIFVDTAMKADQDNDYTVFATWGVGVDRQAYLLDVHREHLAATDMFQTFVQYWRDQRPDLTYIEDTAAGIQLIQDIQRKTAIPVNAVRPILSKEERAKAQAHVVKGAFHIPDPEMLPASQGDWVAEFLSEHTEFPRASHDDQVDTTSMAAEHLKYQLDFWEHEAEDVLNALPQQVQKLIDSRATAAAAASDSVDNVPTGTPWGERGEWMR